MNLMSFGKNTLFYAIGIIVIRLTTFLLIPLYTHYLTQEEYGLLATLLFTSEIIITINDVGMRSAFMRFFSEFSGKNKLSELIGSSISLNIITGIILIIVASLIPDSYIAKIFNTKVIDYIIILTICAGVAKTLSLNILSYFRVKNLGGSYLIISLVTSIILFIITWITLVVENLGISGVLIAQIISFGVVWLLILLWIAFKEGFKINIGTVKMLFKFGYPLIFVTSGVILINTSGNYFLGIFRNLEEVALLSIAYKVASISVMILIAPFQLAFEPYVFNNKHNPKLKSILSKTVTYITLAYLIVSVIILFIFKYLIHFIGSPEYLNSYPLIYLLLPAFLFTAFNYIGQAMIHLNNKTKTTGITSFSITVVSIIISYFCTQAFGIYGTIIGVNFFLIVTGISLFYFGNKEFPIKIEYKRILSVFVLGIFLFIVMYNLSSYDNLSFLIYSLIVFIISISVFYKSSFFCDEEKNFINNSLSSFWKIIKLR